MLMTKQLKRLNISPYDPLYPIPKSGHRHIYIVSRERISYMVSYYKKPSRTFKTITDALCYKFIMLLKIKANLI